MEEKIIQKLRKLSLAYKNLADSHNRLDKFNAYDKGEFSVEIQLLGSIYMNTPMTRTAIHNALLEDIRHKESIVRSLGGVI